MDTHTLLVGAVAGPGGGFDINAADCDHRAFSSKVLKWQAALWTIFIKCAPAVSFLAPRSRTRPPQPYCHSHTFTPLYILAGVPPQPDATGLPPQDYPICNPLLGCCWS